MVKKITLGAMLGVLLVSLLFHTSSVEAGSTQIVRDNLNQYTNGSILGQGGWTDYANGLNFIVQDKTKHEGAKALHISNSVGDNVITKLGQSLSDGRQVVYIRTENRANWGLYPDGNAQVRLSQDSIRSNTFVVVSFKPDGNVAYYESATNSYRNFASFKDNTWTRLVIEWRSSDKTARYQVNSGTWTDWLTFNQAASFTHFDAVTFDFVLPGGSGGVFFDNME